VSAEPKDERSYRAVARSAARLAAVQALYQADCRAVAAEQVIDEFRRFRLSDADEGEGQPDLSRADAKHFAAVALGAELRGAEIDALIDARLPTAWPRARLDRVVRAILRAAGFELVARDDVPAKVVIDEYVSIARAFFCGAEPGFINAILDRLARERRPAEFEADHAGAPRG
jgi:N utilization substance protein B